MAAKGVDRNRISDSDRAKDVAMLQALMASLYSEKSTNPEAFGETSITLKWTGGMLSLVTVEDSATHRPPSYKRHSSSDDTPTDA